MSRAAPAGLSPLLVLAVLLAGCGASTKTVTIEGPPSGATTASSSAANVKTTTTAASASPRSVVRVGSFQSPSGNIGCMIVEASARCDIAHRSWALPARPTSCPSQVDFGQGLIVERSGAARVVCAGDTARDPSSPKLAYGSASQVEALECVSRSNGMTCTNRRDGHGFFLSVQSYRLF